jgi:hypothetical protein
MSLPDPRPGRKLSRLGLYGPFILLGVAAVAWTGAWFWARGEAQTRMDAAVAGLAQAGYPITWKTREVGGYPFRMDITLTEVSARAPSGWALQAPRIEGEAPMHALGSWLIAAPAGVTFVRPVGGPVAVKGDFIRASLTHMERRPPNLSFEGIKLTFTPQPGAQPFALSSAGRVELHLRAGPDDEGGVFASLDNGRAQLTGLAGRIAGDKPISAVWNSTLSKMSTFQGRDWASAVRHWSDAGGKVTVRNAGVTAGEAVLGVNSGTLAVGTDGRLSGALDVSLRQAPRALGVLGQGGVVSPEAAQAAGAVAQAREQAGGAAQASINFQAGQTTLGPVAIGPAPKVYDVR